jgi:hypothetical protein
VTRLGKWNFVWLILMSMRIKSIDMVFEVIWIKGKYEVKYEMKKQGKVEELMVGEMRIEKVTVGELKGKSVTRDLAKKEEGVEKFG